MESMKYFTLVIFLDALVIKEFAKSFDDTNVRVNNGFEAVDGQFPFAVLILLFSNASAYAGCTGSLVTYDLVLTAAHCLIREMLPHTYIMAGKARAHKYKRYRVNSLIMNKFDSYHSTTIQETKAAEFLSHPAYSEDQTFDMGLIKLKKKFKETKFVKTINVILDDITSTMKCTIMGYGITENKTRDRLMFFVESGIENSTLNCGTMRRIPNTYCLYLRSQRICTGDSGGPVVCNGSIYAVNSAGIFPYKWDSSCRTPNIDFYADIAEMERKIKFLSKYLDFDVPKASSHICSKGTVQWQIILCGLNLFFS